MASISGVGMAANAHPTIKKQLEKAKSWRFENRESSTFVDIKFVNKIAYIVNSGKLKRSVRDER